MNTVYIIDDDEFVVQELKVLMESVKYPVRSYIEAKAFLRDYKDQAGCVICDVRLPNISGLKLQEILNQSNYRIPIIFVTAYNDATTAVTALKKGAFDFLVKPLNFNYLFDAVNKALNSDIKQRNLMKKVRAFEELLKSLTPRELEVMELMYKGRATKEIANKLGINPSTVEVHRGNVKKKLAIHTLAELIHKLNDFKQFNYNYKHYLL